MSIFQCENCGCAENTALASTYSWIEPNAYDWTGIEDRKGKKLCSACLPSKFADGSFSGDGHWHGRFPQQFLPLGEFETDGEGNLRHIKTKLSRRDWEEQRKK